jgi:hypothetical protein
MGAASAHGDGKKISVDKRKAGAAYASSLRQRQARNTALLLIPGRT